MKHSPRFLWALLFAAALSPLLALEEIDRDQPDKSSRDTCSHNTRTSELEADKDMAARGSSSNISSDDDDSSSSQTSTDDGQSDSGNDAGTFAHKTDEAKKVAAWLELERESIQEGRIVLSTQEREQLEREAQQDREYWLAESAKFWHGNSAVVGDSIFDYMTVSKGTGEKATQLYNVLNHGATTRIVSTSGDEVNSMKGKLSTGAYEIPPSERWVALEKAKEKKEQTSLSNPWSFSGILKGILTATFLSSASIQRWCSTFENYNYHLPHMTRAAAETFHCPHFDLRAGLKTLPRELHSYKESLFYNTKTGLQVERDSAWSKSIKAVDVLEQTHKENIQLIRAHYEKASAAPEKTTLTQQLNETQEAQHLEMQGILNYLHERATVRTMVSLMRVNDYKSPWQGRGLLYEETKDLFESGNKKRLLGALKEAIAAHEEEGHLVNKVTKYFKEQFDRDSNLSLTLSEHGLQDLKDLEGNLEELLLLKKSKS